MVAENPPCVFDVIVTFKARFESWVYPIAVAITVGIFEKVLLKVIVTVTLSL